MSLPDFDTCNSVPITAQSTDQRTLNDLDELPAPVPPRLTESELGAYAVAALSTSATNIASRRAQFAALGRILRAADIAEVERLFGVRR